MLKKNLKKESPFLHLFSGYKSSDKCLCIQSPASSFPPPGNALLFSRGEVSPGSSFHGTLFAWHALCLFNKEGNHLLFFWCSSPSYVPLIKEMLWTYTTSDFWKVRVSFNAEKQKTTQNTLLPSYTWSAFCFLNPLQLYISEYHIFF